METSTWNITEQHEWYSVEKMLFTYDENEMEENRIAKETAEIILHPKFIPLYPDMLQKWFSMIEVAVYWFIDFFLSSNSRFYCTDEQMAQMLGVGERSISAAVKKLKDEWIINISHRIKWWWWKIRFIELQNSDNMNRKICDSIPQNMRGIENKIIDNKIIKEKEIENLKEKLVVEYQLSQDVVDLVVVFDEYKAWPKIRKYKDPQLKRWVNKLKHDGLDCEEWMIATLNKSIASWYQWTTPIKPREIKKEETQRISSIMRH